MGDTTSIPKKPNTTEGTPARIFINTFIILDKTGWENSDKKTAVKTPIGTPKIRDPNVTTNEHDINGKIPYNPLFGNHSVPNNNFNGPTLIIAGNPDAIK